MKPKTRLVLTTLAIAITGGAAIALATNYFNLGGTIRIVILLGLLAALGRWYTARARKLAASEPNRAQG